MLNPSADLLPLHILNNYVSLAMFQPKTHVYLPVPSAKRLDRVHVIEKQDQRTTHYADKVVMTEEVYGKSSLTRCKVCSYLQVC